MQQLVVTQHTGVNLRYPLEMLTEFILTHGEAFTLSEAELRKRLDTIFLRPPNGGGFVVLGVNSELELVGLLVMESAAATQTGLHRLLALVVHPDYRLKGHGKALLRSGKMLCKDLILLHLDPKNEVANFFRKMGFEETEEALYLERI